MAGGRPRDGHAAAAPPPGTEGLRARALALCTNRHMRRRVMKMNAIELRFFLEDVEKMEARLAAGMPQSEVIRLAAEELIARLPRRR